VAASWYPTQMSLLKTPPSKDARYVDCKHLGTPAPHLCCPPLLSAGLRALACQRNRCAPCSCTNLLSEVCPVLHPPPRAATNGGGIYDSYTTSLALTSTALPTAPPAGRRTAPTRQYGGVFTTSTSATFTDSATVAGCSSSDNGGGIEFEVLYTLRAPGVHVGTPGAHLGYTWGTQVLAPPPTQQACSLAGFAGPWAYSWLSFFGCDPPLHHPSTHTQRQAPWLHSGA